MINTDSWHFRMVKCHCGYGDGKPFHDLRPKTAFGYWFLVARIAVYRTFTVICILLFGSVLFIGATSFMMIVTAFAIPLAIYHWLQLRDTDDIMIPLGDVWRDYIASPLYESWEWLWSFLTSSAEYTQDQDEKDLD